MSKEEPAWKAELREAIHKWDEWEIEAPLRMKGGLLDTLIPHILAAEQRGFQAGVNKTGDSVGKLREQLKTARAAAIREVADHLESIEPIEFALGSVDAVREVLRMAAEAESP